VEVPEMNIREKTLGALPTIEQKFSPKEIDTIKVLQCNLNPACQKFLL